MDNNIDNNVNSNMNNKSNKKNVVIIVLLVLVVCGLVGYFCYDKLIVSNKNDNDQTEKSNKTTDKEDRNDSTESVTNTTKTDFDFDKMKNDLEQLVATKKTQVCTCKDISQPGELNTDLTYKEVSKESIYKVIDKLKEADKYVVQPNSVFGCPYKNVQYIIGNTVYEDDFTIWYIDDNSLTVGYNGEGYTFTYNDSAVLNNFIETLA